MEQAQGNASSTPEQTAVLALTDRHTFCDLLSRARVFKFTGYWEGSAFRRHPCGIVADTVKLTNHWHVDQHCDIYITDGSGWNTRDICRDSFGHGSPHPAPVEGAALKVWDCGRWTDAAYEEALRPRLLDLLTAAARHVHAAEEARQATAARVNQERQREHEAAKRAAIAKATGAAA